MPFFSRRSKTYRASFQWEGTMLTYIKRLIRQNEPSQLNSDHPKSQYPIAQTGQALLANDGRLKVIRKIKRLISVTDVVWSTHYLFAIEQFAELAQLMPASELHHHSNEGGLIDHTLEALHVGTRIAQGYVLPPNTPPEELAKGAEKWRFGVFIAILTHDIGKVVTDIEVVYRGDDGEFQRWYPWCGGLPVGCEYSYRYKPKSGNPAIAKALHEKAGMSLLPRLLTKEATAWLFEDSQLISSLFNTVCHSTFGGQVISEIVRKADGASVSQNLGANGDGRHPEGMATKHSTSTPLQEKVMISLRKLIHDGDLKRNKPGAAIWTTDTETWVVSRTGIDAVRVQLMNEGHKGIPQNPVRIFEILSEHDLLIPNPSSENASIWYGEVNDFAKDWRQKLTFLKFKNELIWPTSTPEIFDGEILPVDAKGKPLSLVPVSKANETPNTDVDNPPTLERSKGDSLPEVTPVNDSSRAPPPFPQPKQESYYRRSRTLNLKRGYGRLAP